VKYKISGAPSVGDLVVALYDEQRGLKCIGLVLECRGTECRIKWGSRSDPIGWWRRAQLRVVQPA